MHPLGIVPFFLLPHVTAFTSGAPSTTRCEAEKLACHKGIGSSRIGCCFDFKTKKYASSIVLRILKPVMSAIFKATVRLLPKYAINSRILYGSVGNLSFTHSTC